MNESSLFNNVEDWIEDQSKIVDFDMEIKNFEKFCPGLTNRPGNWFITVE